MTTSHKGIFLRKSLVTFQFLASVFLISGTFIVYKQLQYLKQRDLGFEMAETLVLQGPGGDLDKKQCLCDAFNDAFGGRGRA